MANETKCIFADLFFMQFGRLETRPGQCEIKRLVHNQTGQAFGYVVVNNDVDPRMI